MTKYRSKKTIKHCHNCGSLNYQDNYDMTFTCLNCGIVFY